MRETENKRLDDREPIEITQGIWWLGFADYEAGFSNNPYLIVDGEEGVLFDPGPEHPFFREMLIQKIRKVMKPEKIKYVVVHHQDPNLWGSIPHLERILHPDLVIITHPGTFPFISYYGIRKRILPVGDNDTLELASGRKLRFIHLPYMHFAGNMAALDEKSQSLFSSDIFGVFDHSWSLYADESYLEKTRYFIEHYVGSKKAIKYAYKRIAGLNPKRIIPQHGSIIEENLEGFLNVLRDAEPGKMVEELDNKPSTAQESQLTEIGLEKLKAATGKDLKASDFSQLLEHLLNEDAINVISVMESIYRAAHEMGVSNPLNFGRNHRWGTIDRSQAFYMYNAINKRLISKQFDLYHGESSKMNSILEQGLQSITEDATVMFINIRGFTEWSGGRSPSEIVHTLNTHFELAARVIHQHNGQINKIMEDMILAYFSKDDCRNWLEAAREIHQAIEENFMLPVGIGCSYGRIILGDFGIESRLNYTVIGDTVNMASRHCSFADKGETSISDQLFDTLTKEEKELIERLPGFHQFTTRVKPNDTEIKGFKFKFNKLEEE